MKPAFRKCQVALAACILLLGVRARAAVYNWNNNTGGNWSTAANWSPSQVPGAADTAVINIAGTYTVNLDVNATVAGLTVGAGTGPTVQTFSTGNQTITVNGPINVSAQGQFNLNGGAFAGASVLSGAITWSGGSISGALTLTNSGVLNIFSGGGNGLKGLVLTNYGTVNWSNATIYSYAPNNAQIYNYGTWNMQSGYGFQGGYQGGTTLFENFGSLVVSNGETTSALDGNVVFNNSGTVFVNGGVFDLQGGGTNSGGILTTTNGGTLNFSGPIFTNTNTFNGEGNYIVGGATFAGTIEGILNWNGGGVSGVMTLTSNAVFNIVQGGGNGLKGLILTNLGTVNWTNTTIYSYGPDNAQIYNYGTWNAQSDYGFQGGYEGGTTLFENYGNFVKSSGTAASTLDSGVSFNNTGRVSIQSGTLDIGAGTSIGGRFVTSTGASLNFISTPYNFNGTNTLNGGGGSLNTGANFNGTINGTLTWNGGSLDGVMTLGTGGALNIVQGGGDGLKGFVLTNYGTVNWSNTTIYSYGSNNAQIYNYGTWIAQADFGFQGGYEGGHTLFDNFGTFLKSGNTGTTSLDGGVIFNNSGTVTSESGTLDIQGGGTNNGTGTFTTTGSGALGLFGINFANNATISSTNVVDIGGNSTINGVLTAPNLQLVSGTLNGGLSGSHLLIGELTWSGGSLSGDLTLASNSVLNIVAGGGNGMMGLRLTNYGTVNWSNATIYSYGPDNAQIYNYGTWNVQSDYGFQGGYEGGTTLFENFGNFVCSNADGIAVLDGSVIFTNTGTIEANNGTLNINGGGSSSGGDIVTTNGGTINFSGMVFTNTNSFSGSGSYVSGGATFGGTVEGTLNWDGGAINGAMTLADNGIFNILAGGGNGLKGLALTNYGIVNWTNTTIYSYGPNNAQIYNYGTWNAQSDYGFQGGYEGGTTLFENYGTFVKSPTAGTTSLDASVTFNNNGRVTVQSGSLNIGAGTGNAGRFGTASGASLSFNQEAYGFDGTNTFTGVGAYVSGGATFDGMIKGTLTWNGGSLDGVMTLANGGALNIVQGGGDGLKGFVLTNYGTVNWSNTTIYSYGSNNAQIYNYGTWIAQADFGFQGGYEGGHTLFDNFGTFLKSGNSGTTSLDGNLVFNNMGIVNVESGTLDITGGGLNSGNGAFVTTNGGVLIVDNMTFPNGATFNSSATVQLGGNTTINGVLTATDLDFASGTLSGTNVLEGTMTWSGGSLSGVMTVASNSVLNIVQGGGNGLNEVVLTNYGTVNWTNATIYGLSTNATAIYNYGLWDAQSDNAFLGGSGTSLFDNFGTFRKSGNTGTTELDGNVVFNNLGTVEAQSGTISLGQNTSLEAGTLNFSINGQTNYGMVELANSTALGGALSVDFNNGFLPASGTTFSLLSGNNLSGNFSTGALPFGMSFAYSTTGVSLVWNGITQADWAAGSSVLYGTTTITFLETPGVTVQLVATGPSGTFVLGATTAGGLGTISFDASQLPNGSYNFQAIVVNAGGQDIGEYSRPAFVNNSLAWHDGILPGNQRWGTNSVNAVDQNVIIPSGVTLRIAPGAIVKFAEGTGIIIEAGGVLDASGATTNDPIVFTSLKDDSVGGDSNEDGNNTVPEPGDWNGILSSGKYLASSFVQVRYILQTHSGILSQSQEWSGPLEHFVTGNVVVPTNVTLTIAPGAIVKMGLGLNITVQPGGNFIANGTIAQPIFITSINDTSVGTSIGTVSGPPAAGDWDSVYFSGGNGIFNHVSLSYGGGPDSLNSGLISITGAGSLVNVTDSVLSQALYRGIEAEYGNVNVTNCVVTGCDRGIQSGLSGPTVVNVINCTLDNNNYALFAHGGVMNVANSIISDSLTAGLAYCCGSSLAVFDHNDVWSATGTYASPIWPVPNQTGIKGNISENPNFVNAAQGNFELDFGSPCIDAADSKVALATDLTGAPRYNDPGTPNKGGTPNASGTYADMGAFEFVQTASSPVDLIANAVIGPATETAGQTVTVQWNDVNIGSGNANGPWHDTISLMPAGGGEPLMAATVLVGQNIVLGPGQKYPAAASVVVPGGNPGSYQWQVQVNSGGDVFEGVNWTNNTALAAAPSFLEDPSLTIAGTPLANRFTSAGQSNVYAVVSPGSTFVLTAQANAPGSALKIFVGDGYVPSTSHFDLQSSQFDSPTASVTVAGNNQDTYYVLVYAVSLSTPSVNYTLSASTVSFALNSVSPSTIVNSGPVTVQVSGEELAAADTYTLAGPGGSFKASAVQISDPTLAFATFNLGGKAAGSYSLIVAQPGGPTLTLSNAILATAAANNTSAESFSVQLELPTAFRANRAFTGSVVYSDTGAVDMPAPIIILSSGGAASLAAQGSTNYVTNDLLLVAASLQGPAGTLSPGQSWTIGFTAFSPNEGTIPFEADYELANSTNLINYSKLGTSLRPAGYSDSDWNAIWTTFQTKAGPTWGGFVSLVDSYSTEMALNGYAGTYYLVQDVLAFAFADILSKANPNIVGTVYLINTNNPVAGVGLLLSSTDTNGAVGGDTSASDGTFAIGGLTPGTYSVSVTGYTLVGPASVTIPASDYMAGVAIIVNRGGTISGTLSNATYGTSPSPASPAYTAQQAGPVLSGITLEAFGTSSNEFTATSDQNGDYTFAGLPPDTYEIVELGGTPGGANSSYPVGAQFAVEHISNLAVSIGTSLVENFMVPLNNAAIAGEVIAAGTTTPVANASVTITPAPNVVVSTNTDSNGVFSYPVYGAAFPVSVSAPGYLPFTGTLLATAPGIPSTVISLTPASTFDFVLDTPSGLAITNGVVTVTSNGVTVGLGVTDVSGKVAISNLAAGTYSVQETAYGYGSVNTTLTVSSGGSETNVSRLAALGGIVGQVSNGSGVPISGITVTVYGDGATNQATQVSEDTDADGNYSALGLPPGHYGVSVGNDGGVEPQQVQIIAAEQHTLNFTLNGSVVQGTVLASDGVTPVPTATVALSQPGQIEATALTDTNGNYVFRVLLAGRYNLAASTISGLSSNQSIAVTGTANLQAAPLVFGQDSLNILVTDTSHNPLANTSITLFPANGGPMVAQVLSAATDATGTAAVGGLVSGPYIIAVHATGFARFVQTLNLSGSTNATFALNAAVTMSGTINNSGGQPISEATVSVFDPATGLLVATTTSSTTGSYSMSDLYLGTYNVLISQSSYASSEIANVVVNANPFTENGVLSSPATSLSGIVTDSSGAPLISGVILITNGTGVTFALLPTSATGTWSTTQLPPGAYGVTLIATGYKAPAPIAVNLAAGTPVTLSNALPASATDDDDSGTDDNYEVFSQSVGDLFKDVLGNSVRPFQITVDPIPPVGDCPEAQAALAAIKAARNIEENAYLNWLSGYSGTSQYLGATGSIGAIQSVVLMMDALAKGTPVGNFEGYKGLASLPGVTQAATIGADASTFLAHLRTTYSDIKSSFDTLDKTDPKSLGNFIAGAAADLAVNGLDITTLRDLQAGLVGAPGNPLAIAADTIALLITVQQGIDDYQAALDTDSSLMFKYEAAVGVYEKAIVRLENANFNCPPINPPPIPPDNPIPGPKQPINSIQSGDPNDKFATGIGQPGWVPEGTAITYTIDFQNETTASAPAQQVTISDPLSASLDRSTLQLTEIAFNNTVINIPAGVQTFTTNASVSTDPNPVSVSASLNPTTGVLSWVIESINPVTGQLVTDPLAGFLPPDNSQQQGEGYVIYTIKPKSGLATGAPITNRASIVFDVNAPIATPTTTNYVGSGAPSITGEPQPVTTNLGGTAVFTVTVAGSAPYLYQWSKDGQTVTGATGSTLVLGNVQDSDAGTYSVSVSTGSASTNSAPAVLTVTTNSSINQIEIVISGKGSVSPPENGKALVIGHTYTLMATPASGYLFANWSGFVFTNTPSLKFVMQNNMLLEANFVPNVFVGAHGVYIGLFAPTDTDREQTNSGAFNFNLTTTGSFSGQLLLGALTVPLNGKFNVAGAAVIQSVRRGASALTTTLQLDLASQAVHGTITDGSFVAVLQGNQAAFGAAQPATTFEGQYTFIIPGNSDSNSGPFGVSYGTVKVSPTGAVTMTGSLADGTAISQSSAVSRNGFWPLYLNLYGGKGSLWGWNQFANHFIASAPNVSWINATNSSKTAVYRSGFTNQEATLAGSYYIPSAKPPLNLGNAAVTLETANPPLTLMNQVTLTANGAIIAPTNGGDISGLTLKITPATGVVSGSFKNPANLKQIIKINGVLLQGATNAAGYYLGTNQSGSFILGPP